MRRLLSPLTNRCAVFSRRGKIRGSSVLAMHSSKGVIFKSFYGGLVVVFCTLDMVLCSTIV